MPRMENGGVSHLADVPITVNFALVAIAAIAALIVLRHLFASVNVSGGVR